MAIDIATTDTIRLAPRISVNKLGEYMTATPLRRRRIVLDQKRPKTFIFARYREAQDAIVKYFVGNRNSGVLTSEIERLRLAPAATAWEEQRQHLCVEALERFLDLGGAVDISGLAASAGRNDQPRLQLGGLEISVRPEVILRGTDRFGRSTAGAIKLYFSKTTPLTAEGGDYVAAAVHQFVDTHVEPGHTDTRHCYVVDVFGGQVFTAPRAMTRRRRDLVAACQEISRAWEAI